MNRQHQGRTGPIVNDAAPFSPEMVQGNHPDRPRVFIAKVGWTTGPVVNDAAPFSPEMSAGYQPDRGLRIQGKTGWFSREPDVTTFDISATFGNHPDRPRIFIAKQGWFTIDLAPAAAPFSMEMVQGALPARGRFHQPHQQWLVMPNDTIVTTTSFTPWLPILGVG